VRRTALQRLARHPRGGGLARATKAKQPNAELAAQDFLDDIGSSLMLKVGEKYFVKTATEYYVGVLKAVDYDFMLLGESAFIPDTGRFNDFMRDGRAEGMEVEPYPDEVMVNLSSVVSVAPWPHDLLREAV